MTDELRWSAIEYEEVAWERDDEDLLLIPKSARRKILPTYQAAIPLKIADRSIKLDSSTAEYISEMLQALVRFDEQQERRGYQLPALLLRSESSASSQIENLTSSVRNVALAEVSNDVPANARIIAGNVAAMRTALGLPKVATLQSICDVHRALMRDTDSAYAGKIRNEQVWIGGTPYSPHGASFVPPRAERVSACLDDLVDFCNRTDVNPIAQAAVAHAQFETIHPFLDGNGRTGRTLLHRQMARAGVLRSMTLPISSGLLHDIDGYIEALNAYHEGDLSLIIDVLVGAMETALVLGRRAAQSIDAIIAEWHDRIEERAGSSMRSLPNVLVEQPVVNVAYVSGKLGITDRAARDLLNRACEYGMVEPMGNRRRGRFFQSSALIAVLEELSGDAGIRRMLAR